MIFEGSCDTEDWSNDAALLEERVLYRTLKGSISATYLEPLKGSIQNPLLKGSIIRVLCNQEKKFYLEPFGFIHYHLICPFRIK